MGKGHGFINPYTLHRKFHDQTKSSKGDESSIAVHNPTKPNKSYHSGPISNHFHTTTWEGKGYIAGKGEGRGGKDQNETHYLRVK